MGWLAYLWLPALGVLILRFALVGDAVLRLIYDPVRPWIQKVLLLDKKLWRRILQFLSDTTLTLVFGAAARLLIPGGSAATGGVGAAVGLVISLMITAAGPYRRHIQGQFSRTS